METLDQLLNVKGQDVWSVAPEASVFEAIQLMADKECGALAVVQDNELVGIISERDYARKVILKGRSSRKTSVQEVMTSRVVTASPDQKVDEGLSLMTHKRIRHLPILRGNTLVGMISIGDLVKSIMAEQEFLIQQLENYVSS